MSKGDWRRPQESSKESFDDNWKESGLGLSPLERRLIEEEKDKEVCLHDQFIAGGDEYIVTGVSCPCSKCSPR